MNKVSLVISCGFVSACLVAVFYWSSSYTRSLSYEQQIVTDLARYIKLSPEQRDQLLAVASPVDVVPRIVRTSPSSCALFRAFPHLSNGISYCPDFGKVPTSVLHAKKLGAVYGNSHVYIKCDNELGGGDPAGNKTRKLQFALADALAHGARDVMTFGCSGSNHAVATTIFAKKMGMSTILPLVHEPNSHVLRRNLLLDLAGGAQLELSYDRKTRAEQVTRIMLDYKKQHGTFPYVIPVGASYPYGIIGFVNAAFELKEQIQSGVLPEPKYIVVPTPTNSGGTAVGLILGCKAAGLACKIISVAVEPQPADWPTEIRDEILEKFKGTAHLLAQHEPSFAHYTLSPDEVTVMEGFEGDEYGLFMPEAVAAMKLFKEAEGIELDGVYSGKAAAGLCKLLQEMPKDTQVLFWNTFCGGDFEHMTRHQNYKDLPQEFHQYFETDVQELDR